MLLLSSALAWAPPRRAPRRGAPLRSQESPAQEDWRTFRARWSVNGLRTSADEPAVDRSIKSSSGSAARGS